MNHEFSETRDEHEDEHESNFYDGDDDDDVQDDLFGFYVEDRYCLQGLRGAIRDLINRENTTSEQIYHLAKLLHAIDRFPRPTKGLYLDLMLGIEHSNGEKACQDLHLDGISFRVGKAYWIIADPTMCGDASSHSYLEVEVGGYRELLHRHAFAEWVEEFQNRVIDLEQILSISDAEDPGAINWDEEPEECDWDHVKSDYL